MLRGTNRKRGSDHSSCFFADDYVTSMFGAGPANPKSSNKRSVGVWLRAAMERVESRCFVAANGVQLVEAGFLGHDFQHPQAPRVYVGPAGRTFSRDMTSSGSDGQFWVDEAIVSLGQNGNAYTLGIGSFAESQEPLFDAVGNALIRIRAYVPVGDTNRFEPGPYKTYAFSSNRAAPTEVTGLGGVAVSILGSSNVQYLTVFAGMNRELVLLR